jgi:hypothetical protein
VQVRALAAYRTGDFAGTVTWLLRSPEAPDGIGGVAGKALWVMVEHRQGKKESARDWLEKARTALANRTRPDRGQSFDPWEPWLVGEVLLREAEAMIEGKEVGPGPKYYPGKAPWSALTGRGACRSAANPWRSPRKVDRGLTVFATQSRAKRGEAQRSFD